MAKPEATWAVWLAAGAALGLAGFAAGHGFEAIDNCAAPDCERVFVNAAERRPRRFCTPTCSNRTRVASYRTRQQGAPTSCGAHPRRLWPCGRRIRNGYGRTAHR
ncbi:MAG TPA: CGNR zinc finger domain-containing protein [Kribbella sp.]